MNRASWITGKKIWALPGKEERCFLSLSDLNSFPRLNLAWASEKIRGKKEEAGEPRLKASGRC